ncbi:MAG TPA: hypothetical protein VGR57_12960, partial [Ktedonobacterales bacterium]|nr:hypothetical protein [Ktedonobacterales bacterium]
APVEPKDAAPPVAAAAPRTWKVPKLPRPSPRMRVLIMAVLLLVALVALAVSAPYAAGAIAANNEQATTTVDAAHSHATQVAAVPTHHYYQTQIALGPSITQTAVVQLTAAAESTFQAFLAQPYVAAVPGCFTASSGIDPNAEWYSSNSSAGQSYICNADNVQLVAQPASQGGYAGMNYVGPYQQLALKHDTQIDVYDLLPNVANVNFSDSVVTLLLAQDGSWQMYSPNNGNLLASGFRALPSAFTVRLRYDGNQESAWVNGVNYATVTIGTGYKYIASVSLAINSIDGSKTAAIRAKNFKFTPFT